MARTTSYLLYRTSTGYKDWPVATYYILVEKRN